MLIDLRNPQVTQGLLAMWLRCRREARLFLEGWSSRDDKDALEYGTLAHHILEVLYRGMRRGENSRSPVVIQNAVRTICRKWSMQKGGMWGEKRTQMHELHSAQLEVLIPLYCEHWEKEDRAAKWAVPEQVFRINRGRWTLTGRIDGAQWLLKRLYLFETKNWSFIPEDSLVATLGFDMQLNFYCLALKKITGTAPTGAILNVIRRPGIAVGKKGLNDYAERLEAAVEKDPGHYFKRFEVAMPRKSLELFEGELDQILEEFGDWLRGTKQDTRFGMPCSVRGSLCKYVPMCHYGIKSIYTQRKTLFPELED